MTLLNKLSVLVRNFSEVRHSLATLADLYGGDGALEALGGLTDGEMEAVGRWARGADTVVEIGTLFGFTAQYLARVLPHNVRIVAVDNFSWNPFGLPARSHEAFARRILAGEIASGRVELVVGDGLDYLRRLPKGGTFVFLDGDHTYEAVRREIAAARESGATWIAGHDYGNARFGVTRAVDEAFGKPDEVFGMVWVKGGIG